MIDTRDRLLLLTSTYQGLCIMHYQRWLSIATSRTSSDRFPRLNRLIKLLSGNLFHLLLDWWTEGRWCVFCLIPVRLAQIFYYQIVVTWHRCLEPAAFKQMWESQKKDYRKFCFYFPVDWDLPLGLFLPSSLASQWKKDGRKRTKKFDAGVLIRMLSKKLRLACPSYLYIYIYIFPFSFASLSFLSWLFFLRIDTLQLRPFWPIPSFLSLFSLLFCKRTYVRIKNSSSFSRVNPPGVLPRRIPSSDKGKRRSRHFLLLVA